MDRDKRALKLLRQSLEDTDETLNHAGYYKAPGLLRDYRKWLITAIQYIQLRNFGKKTPPTT